ncbi:MAG: hypothetical protein D6762_07165 [Candidatus Neomarinimicrobiota bacterium]|nr:MAG: hypothetical protein D6762_07165 [Candidatus Neomarinimicrobiota bacterium]
MKKTGSVWGTVVTGILLEAIVIGFTILILVNTSRPGEDTLVGRVLTGLIGAILAILILVVVVQRLRELKQEEHHDFGQY